MTFTLPALRGDEVGAYLRDGTLNNAVSGGGAAPAAIVANGTARWADIFPGVLGFAVEGTRLSVNGLAFHDEVSLELVFRPNAVMGSSLFWMLAGFAGATSDSPQFNFAYSARMWDPVDSKLAPLSFYHEHNTPANGTDALLIADRWALTPGGIYYIAMTKSAASGGNCDVKVYVRRASTAGDGLIKSGSLIAHVDGTDAANRFYMGANGSNDLNSRTYGLLFDVCVTEREITAEEIKTKADGYFADFPGLVAP